MRRMAGVRGRGRLVRAAVVVYVAISMTVIMGVAALAVDIGTLYSAQAELQRAADASALAAASELVGESSDPQADAEEAANKFANLNQVLKKNVGIDTGGDLEFGHATLDGLSNRWVFSSGAEPTDAVRVTLRRGDGTSAGPVQLTFAALLGHSTKSLAAKATAVLVPRDMAVVVDISNSMCWDSQLRYWNRSDGGYANTRDVWAALNGPEPSRPYSPTSETTSQYAGDTGPTFGIMTSWGNALLPSSYSASSDPALYYIKKSTSLTGATLTAVTNSLTSRGYSSSERSALLSASSDSSNSTHWKNRCAVLLGLATWKSGKSGGLYPPGSSGAGNGDNILASSEVVFVSYPTWRAGSWTWLNYVDWIQSNSGYNDNSNAAHYFRYRYGLKTLTDFLMDNEPENYNTSILWATPEEPLRAIKDAVQSLVDTITEQDSLDHLSLEVFASTSRHERDLTQYLQNIPDRLYQLQSGHYDRATNIAGGLQRAVAELQSARARQNAHKVIVLLSDGVPNILPDGSGTYDGDPGAQQWAKDEAQNAADLGYRIYTISVGVNADRSLLQEIAAIGMGQEFYASGTPDQYSDQLKDIFRSLGGKRPVALIE